MASKLSTQQAEYLILIADHSGVQESDRFWVPPRNGESYSKTLDRHLYVHGTGIASTLRALVEKGYITFILGYEDAYFSRVTEDGLAQIERWRKEGTWPVKVSDKALTAKAKG